MPSQLRADSGPDECLTAPSQPHLQPHPRRSRSTSTENDLPSPNATAATPNSTSNSASNTTAAKTRRSHRKSRNGCTECKRRHIRCDERQPSCANCEVAERACIFPPLKPKKGRQRRSVKDKEQRRVSVGFGVGVSQPVSPDQSSTSSPASSSQPFAAATAPRHRLSPSLAQPYPLRPQDIHDAPKSQTLPSFRTLAAPLEQQQAPPSPDLSRLDLRSPPRSLAQPHASPDIPVSRYHAPPSQPVYTPQDLILLHHAATYPPFNLGPNKSVIDIAVRRAVDSPYLIDVVLALTAFQMATMNPASSNTLRHQATELQTRALACFTRLTDSIPSDDTATCIPRFLFAGILSLHVLADTLAYYRSDFHVFIDRFVECFHLHRGVQAVIRPTWDFLYQSELRPLLSIAHDASEHITTSGSECAELEKLMDDSDLSAPSISACRGAISCLQWTFDVCRGLSPADYQHAASAFSVKVEAEYVDVLRKHRPEALVILAYYGVLLHRCRGFWAFGDAGACMIRAISQHLGSYWQESLTWPLEVLEKERG